MNCLLFCCLVLRIICFYAANTKIISRLIFFTSTSTTTQPPLSTVAKFGTAGLGGVFGWWVVHPFNTVAVRMNLLGANLAPNEKLPSFFEFAKKSAKTKGISTFYDGIGAGTIRQVFYATSRFGLFEVIRDSLAGGPDQTPTAAIRLGSGLASGGMAAVIACPAEVTLVRTANDQALPKEQRRNYKNFGDAAMRILKEEGILAFWRGVVPFAQRAVVSNILFFFVGVGGGVFVCCLLLFLFLSSSLFSLLSSLFSLSLLSFSHLSLSHTHTFPLFSPSSLLLSLSLSLSILSSHSTGCWRLPSRYL